MKVIICEDEQNWRDILSAQIGIWAAAQGVRVEYTICKSPDRLLANMPANAGHTGSTGYDVIFLDIMLGDGVMDGMTLARHIRKAGILTPIIFVTVNPLRAIDGYDVGALGYLLKPVKLNKLTLYMNRIVKTQRWNKTVTISGGSATTKVFYSDIFYIESRDHNITYHTAGGEYEVRGALSDIVSELGYGAFIQVHKSFVVAVGRIVSIQNKYPYGVRLKTDDGFTVISVGRKYFLHLLDAYTSEMFEVMI